MKDTIYIGDDISSDYCYARYGDNYIDLFKNEHLENNTDFYRIYLYNNTFQYEHIFDSFTGNTVLNFVNVSNDFHYRRDFPSIVFVGLVYCMIIIVLLNLVTSIFKKGGVFSGLL